MKIRTKIFLGFLLISGVPLYFLLDWIIDDLTPQYRESTEEPLVDASRVLASLAGSAVSEGAVDVQLFRAAFQDVYSRTFLAKIYNFEKTDVDFRVYITDREGVVIFDSDNGRDEGADYSEWIDVKRTLAGDYGARTSRDIPDEPDASVLYVASPIMVGNNVVGVLTVGKPTRNANELISRAKRKIIIAVLITFLTLVAVGLLLSEKISRPVQQLTEYAKAIRDGKRTVLPNLGSGEIKELGTAFEEMRDALEGKQYVENYVQTLTHEVKSPLSAIQGAAELLREDMPRDKQKKFLDNIKSEGERIKTVVDKMLLLSSLETRKGIEEVEEINLFSLAEEACDSMLPVFERKMLRLKLDGDKDAKCRGERFLMTHAITNLLQNAAEFSRREGEVALEIKKLETQVSLEVKDTGPGVPDFAKEKVFERFYSLKRPDTGRKSSGLGLSLVREVAELHGGSVTLKNGSQGGVIAQLILPALK